MSFIKNIKYSLLSQALVLLTGVAKVLLLPAILEVEDYGYWQVYALYTAYVGVLGFGFLDGIYLKYGAFEYSMLPFEKIRSSVVLYILFLMFSSLLLIFYILHGDDPFKKTALLYAISNILIMGLIGLYIFIFQITNRIKEYSVYNTMDKIIFLGFLMVLLTFNVYSFSFFILSEIVSKAICLFMLLVFYKELVFGRLSHFKVALKEFNDNISTGLSLMIANLSGMLVMGVGRFYLEKMGDIKEFAFYSFGMSLTNLVLVCISGISLVLYPALKRIERSGYGNYFDQGNLIIHFLSLLLFILYFPIYVIIENLFPAFSPTLSYINILFITTILQGKMQLLCNTYYKALRKEKAMLRANLESVFIVLIITITLYNFFPEPKSVAFAVMITMIYRVYTSERFLRKEIGIIGHGIIHKELLLILIFFFCSTVVLISVGFALFLSITILYFWLNLKLIKGLFLSGKS